MEWGGGVDSEFIEENISFLCLFALLGGGGGGCHGLSIVSISKNINCIKLPASWLSSPKST